MFPAIPNAPIKAPRTTSHEVQNASVSRNLFNVFEQQAQIEFSYYVDDVAYTHTYTIDEIQSLRPVEHPIYGPVYRILGNHWFSCKDLSVLSEYTTICCVERKPAHPDHLLLLGETAVLINLLCYTKNDTQKPSLVLRMPINPCDTNETIRNYMSDDFTMIDAF